MFDYLLEKIRDAEFEKSPFKFIYIEDFLRDEHFDLITKNSQINFDEFSDVTDLTNHLAEQDYKPVPFPGCTTDVRDYINWYNGKQIATPSHAKGLIEGFGIAYRIQKYHDPVIQKLMKFLNSLEFLNTLREKFGKSGDGDYTVETAIQKYLTGYEISPHPDIRKKSMTYMLNINPSVDAENMGLSTHFMKFKPEYQHISEFWDKNVNVDRCWVPWDWCETIFEQKANNSITIFAPNNDTMHAVKLDYDMLKTQRTQIYGNLWHVNKPKVRSSSWKEFVND